MTKVKMIMEYMIEDLVEIVVEDQHLEFDEAMKLLYNFQIFEKIMDPETGLYFESPAYVYGLLQDEMNFGRIIQAEI